MLPQRFPCRDRDGHDKRSSVATFVLQQVWLWVGILCRDRVSWSGVMTEYFMSRQSLVKTKGFLIAIEYFHVATELAKVKRFYVAIELPEIVSRQSIRYIVTKSSKT